MRNQYICPGFTETVCHLLVNGCGFEQQYVMVDNTSQTVKALLNDCADRRIYFDFNGCWDDAQHRPNVSYLTITVYQTHDGEQSHTHWEIPIHTGSDKVWCGCTFKIIKDEHSVMVAFIKMLVKGWLVEHG